MHNAVTVSDWSKFGAKHSDCDSFFSYMTRQHKKQNENILIEPFHLVSNELWPLEQQSVLKQRDADLASLVAPRGWADGERTSKTEGGFKLHHNKTSYSSALSQKTYKITTYMLAIVILNIEFHSAPVCSLYKSGFTLKKITQNISNFTTYREDTQENKINKYKACRLAPTPPYHSPVLLGQRQQKQHCCV